MICSCPPSPGGPEGGSGLSCSFRSRCLGPDPGGGNFNFNFNFVLKYGWGRSPEPISDDFCSIFQAGAVRDGPGPNFGQKPTQNRPIYKYIYIYIRRNRPDVTFDVFPGGPPAAGTSFTAVCMIGRGPVIGWVYRALCSTPPSLGQLWGQFVWQQK